MSDKVSRQIRELTAEHKATPKCPQCGKELEKVRRSSNSMLNSEQFDAVRAGDWFCECHHNGRGNTEYAYFWDREVIPSLPVPPAAPSEEAEIPFDDEGEHEEDCPCFGDDVPHSEDCANCTCDRSTPLAIEGQQEAAMPILCILCGKDWEGHYGLGSRMVCYNHIPSKMGIISGNYFTPPLESGKAAAPDSQPSPKPLPAPSAKCKCGHGRNEHTLLDDVQGDGLCINDRCDCEVFQLPWDESLPAPSADDEERIEFAPTEEGRIPELPPLIISSSDCETADKWVAIVEAQGASWKGAYRDTKAAFIRRSAQLSEVITERDSLREQVDSLKGRYDEEFKIVERVWSALGISTYEQAGGKAIHEIVANLKAERDEQYEHARVAKEWAACWHKVVETVLTISGLSPELGADEATVALSSLQSQEAPWIEIKEGVELTSDMEVGRWMGKKWVITRMEGPAEGWTMIRPNDYYTHYRMLNPPPPQESKSDAGERRGSR